MNKSVSVGDRIEPSDLIFMNRWQDVKLMSQQDNHEEVWKKQHLFRATEMDITICFLLTQQGYCANCKNLKVWRECNKLQCTYKPRGRPVAIASAYTVLGPGCVHCKLQHSNEGMARPHIRQTSSTPACQLAEAVRLGASANACSIESSGHVSNTVRSFPVYQTLEAATREGEGQGHRPECTVTFFPPEHDEYEKLARSWKAALRTRSR